MIIDIGKVIVEESDLAETINDHYIKIRLKSCKFVLDANSFEDDVLLTK